MRRSALMLFVLCFMGLVGSSSWGQQVPLVPTTAPRSSSPDQYIRSNRLGITFISSAQIEPQDSRYRNALLLGAGWTRWPLYWREAEVVPGTFDWRRYDRLVIDDMRFGLQINAILLDRPEFYQEGNIFTGLNEPVFADGSDAPGPNKTINPNNPWARFVYEAVQRYKPGGTLAQEQGWFNGEGIRVWEMWNEPDYEGFWRGGIVNYARLLKVGYLAAHHADQQAVVMFGGLLYNTPQNWLARVLAIYSQDGRAAANNWYMDAVGVHSYGYPWRTGWLTTFVDDTLDAYNLDRLIFVNETGVSVWNDYPGPVWINDSSQRFGRATADQAARFVVQSTAYAWLRGADVVMHHQLFDDCGDQAAGTNFSPHRGELCTGDNACFGDAFGLFRNTSNSICYSQHPAPGTPRPAATAYRMLAEVFGTGGFADGQIRREDGLTEISFNRYSTDERIRVVWNRRFEPNTASLVAEGDAARLYTFAGTTSITPINGAYGITLQAAEPDNIAQLEANDISALGGEPIILVERVNGGLDLVQPDATPVIRSDQVPTAAPIQPTIGPITPPESPTTVPLQDTSPPVTSMQALPEISPATFPIRWSAADDGQIDRYMVWVQINDSEWMPYLETARTEGFYTGEAGNVYRFAVWAVDTAGNWSTNIELLPQAETRVE